MPSSIQTGIYYVSDRYSDPQADGTLRLRPIYSGDLDLIRAFIAAGADVNVTGIWSKNKGRFYTDAPANCTLLDGAVNKRTDKVELCGTCWPLNAPSTEPDTSPSRICILL